MAILNSDRLFPVEPYVRDMARSLYETVCDLPIVSPHGHCDPSWFAKNERFPNPAELFVVPDHYAFRMLVSQGISMDSLGVPRTDGKTNANDPRAIWRILAENFHLFRGTPTSMWLEHSFQHVFGLDVPLSAETADHYYDHIDQKLGTPDFLPRALFERFNIEVLATTESALDDLQWHKQIANSGWQGRVVTTYRPDAVVDPDFENFATNVKQFGEITGEDTTSWQGYLQAHRVRRAEFKAFGATASDHGHATARTADLATADAETLFLKVTSGTFTPEEADLFRGQMITEMARMSLDDGLTLQLHAGSRRNHHRGVLATYGRDKGFDIPGRTDFVSALQPLLNVVGFEPELKIIVFTLDETTYARELAPLAGAYPALYLGPPWWFFDSYEGIKRFREATTETCGFYNTVGFNDDTRAFCSIPARHDVARRSDCSYLAQLVATGRLRENEAYQVAYDLTYGLVKKAYQL
ncbi:glucuronate isomerase [Maritalea mediterranea]|uniref:Uronate isomerase n=1 Tax=Maritalea mediterranea TaxID=2909667 RepID=A0ABS9EC56_9HYPH|nr:glucuronate isomerase [Maritalea mediterranea]MCF4099345.1 glucuronate isomerase [Maritalea mediterranea]